MLSLCVYYDLYGCSPNCIFWICLEKRTKIYKKRPGFAHFFLKKEVFSITFFAPGSHAGPVAEEALGRVVSLEHVAVPALELADHAVVQLWRDDHPVLRRFRQFRAFCWNGKSLDLSIILTLLGVVESVCEMIILFVQYLAFYNNENMPNSIKSWPSRYKSVANNIFCNLGQ